MKLVKHISEQYNLSRAKEIVCENVAFPRGFSQFMEALVIEGLIPETYKSTHDGAGYVWADHAKMGGLTIETTSHPLVSKSVTLKVRGIPSALEVLNHVLVSQGVCESRIVATDVKLTHEYHEELTPELWERDGDSFKLKSDVKQQLLQVADAFVESLKLAELDIKDIIVTGSVANFNWTPSSDVDLHILTDVRVAKKMYGPVIAEYFEAKRRLWNDMHDIKMHGFPVEAYVQDSEEKHHSTGVYSILFDHWVVEPKYSKPTVDDSLVKTKLAQLMNEIDDVVSGCNKAEVVERLFDRIMTMRKTGLERAGEFSYENLVFKELRRNGYIEKLADCKVQAFDRKLSIEDEAWSELEME